MIFIRADALTDREAFLFSKRLFMEDNKIYWLIWEIGSSTGLRISDVLNLSTKRILSKSFYIKEIKTKKKKHVYIRQNILFEFVKFARENRLHGNDKAFKISRQTVWKKFKQTAEKCGINKSIGTHTMRHTCAHHNIKKMGLKKLQKKLNHDRITDTYFYTLENEEIQ